MTKPLPGHDPEDSISSSDREDTFVPPTSSTLRLQPRMDAPAQARRHLDEACRELAPEVRSDAGLVLSEIVTNAVVHARTMITIAIECDESAVAVAVTDNSTGVPQLRLHGGLGEGGRGLLLVEELASAWGCDATNDGEGKVVWFRIGA